ncbi:hypothetical protein DFH09DRAFT_1342325 [Mycena vulgaris]|nr:hypothetical protein DFH09DRAFT_1342325 [Mycena vulgaris]
MQGQDECDATVRASSTSTVKILLARGRGRTHVLTPSFLSAALATRRHATPLAIVGGAMPVLVLILLRSDWTTGAVLDATGTTIQDGHDTRGELRNADDDDSGRRVQERACSPAFYAELDFYDVLPSFVPKLQRRDCFLNLTGQWI